MKDLKPTSAQTQETRGCSMKKQIITIALGFAASGFLRISGQKL
jgi:hypothetical protein